MTFEELKIRGWLAIRDNPNDPQEIDDTTMGSLINEALVDISPHLNIKTSTVLSFTNGVASLPTGCLHIEAVQYGSDEEDTWLEQITDIKDKVADDATTQQFYVPNLSQIYIYGITPAKTVTLWSKQRITALSDKTDEPSDVPLQFQAAIPEVFVKAKHALFNGKLNVYGGLMNIWSQTKTDVATEVQRMRRSNGYKARKAVWR